MKTYPTKKLGEVLERVSKMPSILTKNYSEKGKYPIVDQGQSLIAGYTDDASRGYKGTLPVIIFGDHTRSIKFIDFPFAVGADGTQILRPISEIDAKYFYYFLHSVDIPARGYARHFSLLKKFEIPVPPVGVQRKIVAKIEKQFAKIDEAARLRAESKALADQLLPAALHEIFSSAESKGWEENELGSLIGIKHGYAFKSQYFTSAGDYVLLTPGNFHERGGFRDRGNKQKYYTGPVPEDFVLREDSMLVAMTEQARGLLGSAIFVPESGRFLHNQRLGLIEFKGQIKIDAKFLYHFFNATSTRDAIESGAVGTKVLHTSPKKILKIKISLPPLVEQKAIVKKLDALAEKVRALRDLQSSQSADLKALKQSILHQAFAQ